MMHTTIYWTKEGMKIKDKICKYFGIGSYMSINGETPIDIDDAKANDLKITENRGLIQIRNKKDGDRKD